ncbi:unnamed protein product [Rhizoctonia solani]|uniref:Lysine-specific metallo-endopeptidase domain-containing protein n=1 Tax=Rhizoctonia solani TaxID=456999 RepID=A0A8H3GQ69_9AGAM|nr:unnamed protein product [Rhizoctonia solani]
MKAAISALFLLTLCFCVLADIGPVMGVSVDLTNEHQPQIVGTLDSSGIRTTKRAPKKRVKFVGCDDAQKKKIRTAATTLRQRFRRAADFLNKNADKTRRYETWFGKFDVDRFALVKSRITKAKEDFPQVIYNCEACRTDPEYDTKSAYRSDVGNTINLCGKFWELPAHDEHSSQARAIIHEILQFNPLIRDNTIGHIPAQALAKEDPGSAIENTENYIYL